MEIKFHTFRELKEALNRIPEELLEDKVELFDDFGISSEGGAIDILDGNVSITAVS